MVSLFQNIIQRTNKKEKKISSQELITLFKEARKNNEKELENYYFNEIYKKTKSALNLYIGMGFNQVYPGYNDELDSEFQFQLLRRIDDYGDIMLEHEGKKRGQKLGNNGKNQNQEKNFNLMSLAIALTKSIHMKLIHKFNDKTSSLQEIKTAYKNQTDIKYLNTFSDMEQKIKSSGNDDIIFEVEDTTEDNKYHYGISEVSNLLQEYFKNNPKRLYTMYKKEIRKDKQSAEEKLMNTIESLKLGIIDDKVTKIIQEIKERDFLSYEKIINVLGI